MSFEGGNGGVGVEAMVCVVSSVPKASSAGAGVDSEGLEDGCDVIEGCVGVVANVCVVSSVPKASGV